MERHGMQHLVSWRWEGNMRGVVCRCEIKGWTLKYDKSDLNLMWNEKTLAEIFQKGNSLSGYKMEFCCLEEGYAQLLPRKDLCLWWCSGILRSGCPRGWAYWRCRRKRSTCVFWWNTAYIYTSLYTYLHIATCLCVATLAEAWTSRSPAKGLVVVEGEPFSWSPLSMHSKVPQVPQGFHTISFTTTISQGSPDALAWTQWPARGQQCLPPHWPLQRLNKGGCQTLPLLQTAEKGTSLHPDGWRWEISQGKYKVINALVYSVKDSKTRNGPKLHSAIDAVYYSRDI